MFEIAWTLNRQSAQGQLYPHIALYNFADNHDTNRVASMLKNKAHLFPLYGLLFTIPGIPSLYYGSEYGIEGARDDWSDRALRPAWDEGWAKRPGAADLVRAIGKFAAIRRSCPALEPGGYRELLVAAEQFAFMREWAGERIAVMVNGAEHPVTVSLGQGKLDASAGRLWRDLLSGETFTAGDTGLMVPLWPNWVRILREE
jgi:glycosidase